MWFQLRALWDAISPPPPFWWPNQLKAIHVVVAITDTSLGFGVNLVSDICPIGLRWDTSPIPGEAEPTSPSDNRTQRVHGGPLAGEALGFAEIFRSQQVCSSVAIGNRVLSNLTAGL